MFGFHQDLIVGFTKFIAQTMSHEHVQRVQETDYVDTLASQDEREGLVGALRNEAKAAGVPDTPEAGLEFLISRIKSNLHVALCFSPVGDIFRIRETG